jgi:hypothetical protein
MPLIPVTSLSLDRSSCDHGLMPDSHETGCEKKKRDDNPELRTIGSAKEEEEEEEKK